VSTLRIGQGVDAHQLVAGRRLVLGGIEIPYERGLEGHSDGDVLLHAISSAMLGALGEGDLGQHFPSSDPGLRDISSIRILETVVAMMHAADFVLENLDATVIAQEPRLAPFLSAMRDKIAQVVGVSESSVNVKCTSTDHLGALGRAEGMAASVVVLLHSRVDYEVE